jgi:cell filamentation protein
LQSVGHDPFEHNIRTGRPGETIAGSIVGTDDRSASLVTEKGVVVVPRADMPARAVSIGDDVTVTVRSPYQAVGMERTAPAVQQPDKTASYWTRAVESGRAIQATERGNRQGYEADRSQDHTPAQGR